MVPDRLPEALRSLIAQFPPGALQFEVGIQTFNPEVETLISRRQNQDRLSDNLRWLRQPRGVHRVAIDPVDVGRQRARLERLERTPVHVEQYVVQSRLLVGRLTHDRRARNVRVVVRRRADDVEADDVAERYAELGFLESGRDVGVRSGIDIGIDANADRSPLACLPGRGIEVVNYASFLAENPPFLEVEIKPGTAWSCSHGLGRWKEDCGCGGGAWHQKWRGPLRRALDWLRDELALIFDKEARAVLRDPWAARDAYIDLGGPDLDLRGAGPF